METIDTLKGNVRSTLSLDGSKSLTNRLSFLAALGKHKKKIENVLISIDTKYLFSAFQLLGIKTELDEINQSVTIHGCSGRLPNNRADFYLGNSGIAARFLIPMLGVSKDGIYHLDGDERLRNRPLGNLLDVLMKLEVAKFEFEGKENCFPFMMKTYGFKSGGIDIDISKSSQMLSAMLMVLPFTNSELFVKVDKNHYDNGFVNMSLKQLKKFGHNISFYERNNYIKFWHEETIIFKDELLEVEPDASLAGFFMMLPIIHGGVILIDRLKSWDSQPDFKFIEIIISQIEYQAAFVNGKMCCSSGGLKMLDRSDYEFDLIQCPDMFFPLCSIAPLIHGEVLLKGLAKKRLGGIDLLSAMAFELQKVGCEVEVGVDFLKIKSDRHQFENVVKNGIKVDCQGDHRVGMAMAILGTYPGSDNSIDSWMKIEDTKICTDVFPNFFKLLDKCIMK